MLKAVFRAILAAGFFCLMPVAAQAQSLSCPDNFVEIPDAGYPSLSAWQVNITEYCTAASPSSIQVVSVNNWPSMYWSLNGGGVFIDGFYMTETISITVTDGVSETTFNLTFYLV